MSTENQIAANRKNAQLCTGPKTDQGKARSSQNALKTGIYAKREVLIIETRQDYEQLIADFHNEYNPATPQERSLVDALIRYEWRSRRYMAAETDAWNRMLHFGAESSIGATFLHESRTLLRAGNHFNAIRRAFAQTLKQLHALQAERKAAEAKRPVEHETAEPQPKQSKHPEPKSVSFRQEELITLAQLERTAALPEIPPLAA